MPNRTNDPLQLRLVNAEYAQMAQTELDYVSEHRRNRIKGGLPEVGRALSPWTTLPHYGRKGKQTMPWNTF